MRLVHSRTLVVLGPRRYDLWMDRQVQEPTELAEAMRSYPVSPWVNDPRHDDARRLEPAA